MNQEANEWYVKNPEIGAIFVFGFALAVVWVIDAFQHRTMKVDGFVLGGCAVLGSYTAAKLKQQGQRRQKPPQA